MSGGGAIGNHLLLSIPFAFGAATAQRRAQVCRMAGRIEEHGAAGVRWHDLPSRSIACEALLHRGWALRFSDSRQMLVLCELAATLAAGLGPRGHCSRHVRDIRCLADAELANAYRVNGDLRSAWRSFDTALQSFAAGTHAALLAARLANIQGLLLASGGNLDGAMAALDSALAAYSQQRLPHLVSATLLNKGLLLSCTGRPHEAAALLRKAAQLADPERDPASAWIADHTLSMALVSMGNYREASRRLAWSGPLYDRHKGPHGRNILRWLQGRVHAGCGEPDRAAAAFDDARQATLARGEPYNAACIAFELCAVLAAGYDPEGARTLAGQAADQVLQLDVPDEVGRAMLLLKTSLRFGLGGDITRYDRVSAFLTAASIDRKATLQDFVRRE